MKENVEIVKTTLVRHNTDSGPIERTYTKGETYPKVLQADYDQLVEKGGVETPKAQHGGGGTAAKPR